MIYAHITFAVSFISLMVALAAFYMFVRNPSNRLMLYNFIFFISSAVSLFGLFNIQLNRDPGSASFWTRLVYAGLSGYIFSFPQYVATVTRRPLNRTARIILANISGLFIFLILFTDTIITIQADQYARFFQGRHGPLYAIFIAVFFTVLFYSFLYLIRQRRRDPDPAYDQRPLLIGSGLAIIFGSLDVIGAAQNQPLFPFLPYPSIIAILVAVASFILTFLSQYTWILRTLSRTEVELQSLLDKSNRSFLEFVQLIAKTLDAKDHYTAGHSLRVMNYAVQIGQALGLSETEIELLRQACLLHDIGKICIPDGILNKKSSLNDRDWEYIIKHPIVGRQILSTVSDFHGLLDIIYSHHERVDGRGYPKGLNRDEIPLLARILSVADTFDAMCSERPYRKARTRAQAIEELKKNRGSQLDEKIVDIFIELQRE